MSKKRFHSYSNGLQRTIIRWSRCANITKTEEKIHPQIMIKHFHRNKSSIIKSFFSVSMCDYYIYLLVSHQCCARQQRQVLFLRSWRECLLCDYTSTALVQTQACPHTQSVIRKFLLKNSQTFICCPLVFQLDMHCSWFNSLAFRYFKWTSLFFTMKRNTACSILFSNEITFSEALLN